MKILMITPAPPYPLYGGFELRVFNLCKQLVKNHEIDLISECDERVSEETENALRDVFSSVRFFLAGRLSSSDRRKRSAIKRIRELISPPVDYYQTTSFSSEMSEAVRREVLSGECDVIHLVGVDVLRYLPDVEKYSAVCDVIDNHSLFCKRIIQQKEGFLHKAGFFYEWLATRQFEKKFIHKFKKAIFVSPVDADAMKSIDSAADVAVVPNGVNSDYFQPDRGRAGEETLLFTGVMDYEPNVSAALHFVGKVMPKIKMEAPEVRVQLVGRDPDDRLVKMAARDPGIKLTGFVEDMRLYFNQATVYVSPLLSGAGMKNKILEAWSMAMPVVATSLSCEGIEVENGQNILIADKPSDFAEAVLRLLRDPALRKSLGENARRKIEETYSWSAQAGKLEEIYKEITRANQRSTDLSAPS